MDDLISRNAAVDIIRKMPLVEVTSDCMLIDKAIAVHGIMWLPSAQPERKRGRWIEETSVTGSHTGGIAVVHTGRVYCSECDESEDYRRYFCPNCGADMRGDQDG